MKLFFTLFKSSLIILLVLVSFCTFAQQSYVVNTSGSTAFIPSVLNINVGDTVTWINNGGTHNVNGTTLTFAANPVSFGGFSPSSGAPEWPFTFVFTVVGDYQYQCDPHSGSMQGSISVSAPLMDCSDLFFSEYIEGTGLNKAIEIFNPTPNSINLSNYILERYSNGTSTPFLIGMSGTIAPYDVYVCTRTTADSLMIVVGDSLYATEINHNGNDAYALRNLLTNAVIDVFGQPGVDIGNWPITGTNAVNATAENQTLVRDASVSKGQLNWTTSSISEWAVYPQNDFQFLGSHSSTMCQAAAGTICSDIFISEYLEGASNNKALEIYNPNNASVDLSDYYLLRDNNGGTTSTDTFQMDGMLAPGNVYVIANPSAVSEILNAADTTSTVTFYNGDDAIRLVKISTGDLIDVVGVLGVDPGSNWTVNGTNGVIGATNEFDLVRDPSVSIGDTSWTNVVSNQWYVLDRGNFNNLGIHNAPVCSSTVPAYLIEQLKGLDANLAPDSLGVQAQLTGIVHNPDQGFNSSEFAMQDGTAGIWVTGADPIPGYPTGTNEGDIIRVFGTVAFANGVTRFSADSINLLGNANLYIAEKVDTLNEYSEGRYVKLDSVRIINNTQDSFDITGGGVNYTIVTIQSDTFTMRVDRDYELDFEGNPVPTGLFNLTGVGSQFDGSAPHNSGYQIFPSRYSDLEVLTVSGDFISFSSVADVVDENGGSYQILITTTDTLAVVSTVDLVNTGNGSAVSGTDFIFADTTLTFSNTSIDSFLIDVTIIDNAVVNPDRTIEFALRNITGASYGLDTVFVLTIINDDIPTYDIGTIRGNDNLNGTTNVGVADSLGVTCRIFALVTTPNIGGSSLSVTFQDATGAISIFQPGSTNPPALVPGDSVEIVGDIGQFNGLSQFTNSTVINVISSGNALPTPLVVDSIGEFTESRLIQLNNMSFVDPALWTASAGGSSFNIDITNGIDTFVLRVDSDLSVHSQTTPPAAPFDLVCFGGQFDSSDPYTSGYQVFAIDSAGFIPSAVPGLPTYPISSVTTNNTNGIADSVGTECKIVGIAYGENFRVSSAGLEFTLIDATSTNDGIAVFSTTSLGYTVNEGDELRVIGTIDQVFGLTRIVADSIVVISSGNTLKAPSSVTSLDEFSESNLVEVAPVTYLSEGNWTNSGSSFTVRFTNGTDTFSVRIDNDCDLYTASEPSVTSSYSVVGIGGQIDLATPFDSDYVLLPRRSSDLSAIGGIGNGLANNNIKVYPNPSTGVFTVSGLAADASEITVTDLLGRLVYSEMSNSTSVELDLSILKAGQYILKTNSKTELNRFVIVITE